MIKNTVKILSLWLLTLSQVALATSIVEMDVTTLTRTSARVVTASVVDQESRFDSSGKIITTFSTLEVDEVLRGKSGAKRRLIVEQLGGTIGEITQKAHGMTLLRRNDRFLLFLQAAELSPQMGAVHKVTGFSQGIYRIRRNPNGQLVAAPPLLGDTHRFIRDAHGKLTRRSTTSRATSLDELRATILAVPEP